MEMVEILDPLLLSSYKNAFFFSCCLFSLHFLVAFPRCVSRLIVLLLPRFMDISLSLSLMFLMVVYFTFHSYLTSHLVLMSTQLPVATRSFMVKVVVEAEEAEEVMEVMANHPIVPYTGSWGHQTERPLPYTELLDQVFRMLDSQCGFIRREVEYILSHQSTFSQKREPHLWKENNPDFPNAYVKYKLGKSTSASAMLIQPLGNENVEGEQCDTCKKSMEQAAKTRKKVSC
ncbi:uncharacterized protein LY89DRAFT_721225 [Mollisia scopiformis]|uniref:Uncharacterized protein n=1 Tax=Mollisia scopiformis TaxID=149040 RepID=A0A194X1Q3_MOLSC|nr:uncharacterized protein LY89DRAFT_721225 [Mollisia scopiformis]KUJ14123.1 hypothetical protein LY89DRAFT_721225 [Mollisia scopiformis]